MPLRGQPTIKIGAFEGADIVAAVAGVMVVVTSLTDRSRSGRTTANGRFDGGHLTLEGHNIGVDGTTQVAGVLVTLVDCCRDRTRGVRVANQRYGADRRRGPFRLAFPSSRYSRSLGRRAVTGTTQPMGNLVSLPVNTDSKMASADSIAQSA